MACGTGADPMSCVLGYIDEGAGYLLKPQWFMHPVAQQLALLQDIKTESAKLSTLRKKKLHEATMRRGANLIHVTMTQLS